VQETNAVRSEIRSFTWSQRSLSGAGEPYWRQHTNRLACVDLQWTGTLVCQLFHRILLG